jgi:phage terminase large subunit GpA-like protein
MLSPEASAEPGRWNTSRQPYQREIMDAMGDRTVPLVVLMTSSQVGKTEMSLNLVGYHMDQDPAPMLVIQPTLDMAETWSKDRLAPMLRDTRTLQGKVADSRSRDSGNTILHKEFDGGQLSMAGANSAASLSMRPIRVLICDEVDRYPASAGGEGDPIALAQKRTTTFWNRKVVLTSTPTIMGFSRIDRAWNTSDQRYYEVPCPQCGEFQRLEWGGKTASYGMKWKQDEAGRHLPETAYYVCRHNGCIIEERSKGEMVHGGRWISTRPFAGIAGFHIWAAYSLQVNSSWPHLVQEWLDAKGDALTRQTFVNLVLGLPYEERDDKTLSERRLVGQVEVFAAEVPDRVAALTAGVDVQHDRIEIEVVGWGRNEESWSIAHEVIEGDPDAVETWGQVDEFLKRIWFRGDGRGFEVRAACVDSGGHHTQRVYEFCKARLGRHIWAIKGEAARTGTRSPVWPTKRPSARNRQAFRPIIIGVNAAKDVIRSRLHLQPPGPDEACPGFMHFPADRDINYFAQLVAERSKMKQVGAVKYRVWELLPGRANEALDLRVYAYAALCGMAHFGFRLNRRADELAPDVTTVAIPPAPKAPMALPAAPTITSPDAPARRSRFAHKLAR